MGNEVEQNNEDSDRKTKTIPVMHSLRNELHTAPIQQDLTGLGLLLLALPVVIITTRCGPPF